MPLIEFRHRSWMEEDEREDTLAFLERNGLAYVSVDSPRTRASNVLPRIAAATHAVAYVRFHGRNTQTWNIRGGTSADRFDWLYSPEELEEWVGPVQRLAEEADEVYALFNNNRDDFAPRSAATFRGLLDEAGVPATGGIEPPPTRADAVLRAVGLRPRRYRPACASSRSSTTRRGPAGAGCSRPSRSRAATATSAGWRPTGRTRPTRRRTTRSWSSVARCTPTRTRSTPGSPARRRSSAPRSRRACRCSASASAPS